MDDLYNIVWNPLVHSVQGVWHAFGGPYWPPDLGGQMYRPLPLADFAMDWAISRGHPVWFHAMNLLWHAGVAAIVTALALRSPSPDGRGGQGMRTTALAAGLIFSVHPVHVEAVRRGCGTDAGAVTSRRLAAHASRAALLPLPGLRSHPSTRRAVARRYRGGGLAPRADAMTRAGRQRGDDRGDETWYRAHPQ